LKRIRRQQRQSKESNVPRGGKRNGSGRKKGAATKKTRAIADRQSASGKIMPLDVMMDAMRDLYDAGNRVAAAEVARHAAPYCHARLSSVEHSGRLGVHMEIIEELTSASPESGSQNGQAASGAARLPS
jgi:hypothetical protein